LLVRVAATVVVLCMIRGGLGWGSRGNLLLLLRLLGLYWCGRFGRGRLDSGRRCRSRGGTRPWRNEMRDSWLSGAITSIGNNLANLFDLLPLDFPNEAYSTTFLLFWFVLRLLGCTTDRGRCFNRTNRLGGSGDQRASSCANVFANTNLYALISHSTRELRGLLHAGELLGRVDVEGSRVDRFTMPNRCPNNLKQGKFETVASFHSHTEIGEYEKGSIFPAIL
jgi:hypothetical protein